MFGVSIISYLKKMMDLLWYKLIRDLVGGSNELLGYRNKSGAKFAKITVREARLEMASSIKCILHKINMKLLLIVMYSKWI